MPCVLRSRCVVGNATLFSKLSMHPKCFKLYHTESDYKNNWILVDGNVPNYVSLCKKYILENFSNIGVDYTEGQHSKQNPLHFGP